METRKSIYLMAGGRGSRAADKVMKAVFSELNQPRPSIAYIGAASGDDPAFFSFMSGMIRRTADCNISRVLLVDPASDVSRARAELTRADAVFFSGGDVEAGMQVLADRQVVPFFKELYTEGKLFFGASAGSIMLADHWVRWRDPEDDSTAELFPCLGLAPVLCDTHAEEDHWEELQWALRLDSPGLTGYGIPTNSCLRVSPSGQLSALGGPVARFTRRPDGITALPDLRPG